MKTELLQGECREAVRVPCRTKLRLEHAPTGRRLHGRGVDLSIHGMLIRVSAVEALEFRPGDGLCLRIDPEEDDYLEAMDTMILASVIVRVEPSRQEGFTDVGVKFLHRLIPQPSLEDSENLHQ